MSPAVNWIELQSSGECMVALLSCLHAQQTIELLGTLIWYLMNQLRLIVTLVCLLPSD